MPFSHSSQLPPFNNASGATLDNSHYSITCDVSHELREQLLQCISTIVHCGVSAMSASPCYGALLAHSEESLNLIHELTYNYSSAERFIGGISWSEWFGLRILQGGICATAGRDPFPLSVFIVPAGLCISQVSSARCSVIFSGIFNSHIVCVKRLRSVGTLNVTNTQTLYQMITDRVAKWQKLSHVNVLRIMGLDINSQPTSPRLVMSWLENIEILIYRMNPKPTILQLNKWLLGIASGLLYLHDSGVVHGALRASNVLMGPDGTPQLSDYDMFDWVEDESAVGHWPFRARQRWWAPEVCAYGPGVGSSCLADVFSFGCVCIELYTNNIPFPNLSDFEIKARIQEGQLVFRKPTPQECVTPFTDSLWIVIQRCFASAPYTRITPRQLVLILTKMVDRQDKYPELYPNGLERRENSDRGQLHNHVL